jgi:lysophospholipase L1-like esterase
MRLGTRSALACVAACALFGPLAGNARAAGGQALEFDWSMPESYGHVLDTNGLPAPTEARSVPTYPHTVDFTIKDCSSKRDYRLSAQGATLKVLARAGCTYTVNGFPRFGAYRVRVSVERHGLVVEAEEEVELEQWLIVSLGDSVASGEGVPERVLPGLRARWEDAQCHRSGYAGPAVAAHELAEGNPRVEVTFVHLACSGATIRKGLLGPYKGIAGPIFRPALRPQVDELEKLPQSPTAVLVSIGANDVNFSGLTKLCFLRRLLRLGCFAGKRLERHLAELPDWYSKLADALAATRKVPPSNVFLTEYFDPTHDDNGVSCQQLETFRRVKILGRRDVEAAYDNLLEPLNWRIAEAVKLSGWREVTGVADAFRTHGICARATWITSLKASLNEGDGFLGTLHPNRDGQRAIAALIEPAIAGAARDSSCPAQGAGNAVQAAYETGLPQPAVLAPAAACIAPITLRVAVVVPNRSNNLGAALWVLIALAILATAALVLGALGHPRTIRRNGRSLAGALTGGMLIALGAALVDHAAPAAVLFSLGAVALLLALQPDAWRSAGTARTRGLRSRTRGVRFSLVGSKIWNTTNLVVVMLGAALVVFFAGTTAAIAAGATAPPALWAAGSAVSGALIGLLVPAPGAKGRHEAAASNAEDRAATATATATAERHRLAGEAGDAKTDEEPANAEAAEKTAREEASAAATHRAAALSSPETKVPAILLAVVFVLSLALAVAMAGGAFSPPTELVPSLKGLITAVVAIASASGGALIGILAPSSGKSDAQQAAAGAGTNS